MNLDDKIRQCEKDIETLLENLKKLKTEKKQKERTFIIGVPFKIKSNGVTREVVILRIWNTYNDIYLLEIQGPASGLTFSENPVRVYDVNSITVDEVKQMLGDYAKNTEILYDVEV